MDIDKVIEGLKYCQKAACVSYKGHKCPYIRSEHEEGCICEMQNDALEALTELMDEVELLKEQDYRTWIIDMFHKYNRDDLIALMVQKGEESLLAGLLKEQPEIVRCKDYMYNSISDSESLGQCLIQYGWFPARPDWFCADGKKRNDDDD